MGPRDEEENSVHAVVIVIALAAGLWFVAFPARQAPLVTDAPPAITGGASGTPLAAAVREDLARYVTNLRRRTGAPGVSAAVVLPDGEPVTAAVGYADVEAGKLLTPENLLLGGSTGKSYCAATVMRLVAAGRLSLDDEISRFLGQRPWFARLPGADALTIRILLTHTGGLPQFLDVGAFQRSFVWDALAGRDTGYPPEKMLSFVSGAESLNAPGADFHYSDLGYVLLGLVVEAVTGRSYYDVLRDEVLTPLEIEWIQPANTQRIKGLAVGYVGNSWVTRVSRMAGRNMDEGGVLRFSPAIEFTGGGLANTPLGLAFFYKRLLEGRLLDRENTVAMVKNAVPSTPLGAGSHYGFGLLIVDRPGFGRYVGHSGWYPGYVSNAAWFADYRFSVAVQVNRDEGIDVYTPLRDIAAGVIERLGKPRPAGH